MQLLPEDQAKLLPPLYAQEKLGDDAIVYVKFFCPWSVWTWYCTEYNPETGIFFGLVVGHEKELGYFSLAELTEIRGIGGLTIERDLHWTPRTLKECRTRLVFAATPP